MVIDKSMSVFVSEDGESYTYKTVLGGVEFKVPKWILFSPRYCGGVIANSVVRKYIIEALDELEGKNEEKGTGK